MIQFNFFSSVDISYYDKLNIILEDQNTEELKTLSILHTNQTSQAKWFLWVSHQSSKTSSAHHTFSQFRSSPSPMSHRVLLYFFSVYCSVLVYSICKSIAIIYKKLYSYVIKLTKSDAAELLNRNHEHSGSASDTLKLQLMSLNHKTETFAK